MDAVTLRLVSEDAMRNNYIYELYGTAKEIHCYIDGMLHALFMHEHLTHKEWQDLLGENDMMYYDFKSQDNDE